jgi:hypothetical protein
MNLAAAHSAAAFFFGREMQVSASAQQAGEISFDCIQNLGFHRGAARGGLPLRIGTAIAESLTLDRAF